MLLNFLAQGKSLPPAEIELSTFGLQRSESATLATAPARHTKLLYYDSICVHYINVITEQYRSSSQAADLKRIRICLFILFYGCAPNLFDVYIAFIILCMLYVCICINIYMCIYLTLFSVYFVYTF